MSMKTNSLLMLMWVTGAHLADAATSIGSQEASPVASQSAAVPVVVESDSAVGALQVDVLFDPDLYEVTLASSEVENALVESRVIEEGRLRVVVAPLGSGALPTGSVFRVPLLAKSGVVEDFPVLLTDFLLVGSDAVPLSTSIAPRVKLLGLRDGKEYNGRVGLELTASAQATAGTISRVQYFAGGIMIGEGVGGNFRFVWMPEMNGPFEITAVALDSNGAVADSRTVPIVVAHVGTFAGAVKGTYVGLLRDDPLSHAGSGYVTMTSSTAGTFTFKVLMGGKSYAGSGAFNEEGLALISLKRKSPLPALNVQLTHSSLASVDQIVGKITDGTISGSAVNGDSFKAEFTVDRVVWDARIRQAPQAGGYTVLLPGADEALGAPKGTGYATLKISTSGASRWAGSLADGASATASSYVSKDGRLPVHLSLYKNLGMVSGWMGFSVGTMGYEGDGGLDWLRPVGKAGSLYEAGFTSSLSATAAPYAKPQRNQTAITVANLGGNVKALFAEGGLTQPMTRLMTLNGSNQIQVPLQGSEKLIAKVNANTGVVTGTFIHPNTGVKTALQGVVSQKDHWVRGYFAGGEFGGPFFLQPNEAWMAFEDPAPLGVSSLPTVAVTSPKAEQTLSSGLSEIIVIGKSADKDGIQSVWWQMLHDGVLSEPLPASGTNNWSFQFPINAGDGGRYTLFIKAIDMTGEESNVLARSFRVLKNADLEVNVTGDGAVTKGYIGITSREVGRLYTLTAAPKPKKQFLGWSGSINSSARSISFVMEEGMQLEANFSP